mgnify:CR=1 FL=1|tara:strand:- start:3583 stop:4290 length:708 start_codon:yes stop_codon:yes gene_type:complete
MDSSEANKENITLDVTDQILDNVDEENEIILPDQDQDDENIMTKDNDSLYGDSDDEYIPPPPESDDKDEEEEEDYEEDQSVSNEQEMLANELDLNSDYGDDEDDSDYEEDYLQKLDSSMQEDIISNFHPELLQHKKEEIDTLSKIVRNEENVIIDPFHKTVPFLTKYEKARILGERAKQLNAGAKPFINLETSMIDGYLIAEKELQEKKIPFIIKRPITNGGCEYWKVEDLEILY